MLLLDAQAPASFSYLGPLAEELSPSNWKSPWAANDRRPLILVSFSTGPYWDQTSRILRTLAAIRGRECRALVTTGSTGVDLGVVPSNAVIVRRVPDDEILSQAAATVTHAGHGTVMASLKHGVPLLCLLNPVADQPILAAQVQDLRCGLSLDGDNATPGEIAGAIDRLISDPSYAANAQVLAGTISKSPGTSAAVSRLEELAAKQGRRR